MEKLSRMIILPTNDVSSVALLAAELGKSAVTNGEFNSF